MSETAICVEKLSKAFDGRPVLEDVSFEVKHGEAVTLLVTRKTDVTCATEMVVPSRGITQELPLNQTVRVALGPLKAGEVAFACGMDMEKGTIVVR